MSGPQKQGPEMPLSSSKTESKSSRSSSEHKKRRRYSSSSSSSSSYSSSSDSDSSSSSSHDREHKRRSSSSKKYRSRKSRRPPGAPTLSVDDFFRYASEFREWLLSSKGIHMSSLKTDEARAIFSSFVRAWNKGKLASRFYAGIEPTSIAASSRNEHRWSFQGVDKTQLASIRDEVNRATSAGKSTSVSSGGREEDEEFFAPYGVSSSVSVGPSHPSSSSTHFRSHRDHERDREDREREHDRYKKERREFRRHERHTEDELAPKATGRDRIYEKRREENYSRRSYEVQRREDPTIDPYDESATDSVASHVRAQEAAIDRKRQERASSMADRAKVAQAKEDQVMEQLRSLSRSAGYKI